MPFAVRSTQSSSVLKKSQANARQGENGRKSAMYTQYVSILRPFLMPHRAG